MQILELNHVALHVADVERSARFYRETLGLAPIPRPAFSFPGAWFQLGAAQELHLIGGRADPVVSHHRGNHFALRVDDLDAWERHLDTRQVAHAARKQRPDGAWQLFLQDPDGHVLELFIGPGATGPASESTLAARHESQ